MDTNTGLWFHGWEFTSPTSGHNYARALWARGNCWITWAIPLLFETVGDRLPKDDPSYRAIRSTFIRQVEQLAKLQDKETGLWHTLLDDPSSYLEVSASAGFAVGIFKGIQQVCILTPYIA